MKAETHNLKWYISAEISKILSSCLSTSLFLWLVSLYCSNVNLKLLLNWIDPCMMFQYFGKKIFIFYPERPWATLKLHVLWCTTGIHSWNLSKKASLMYEDSLPISLCCNLNYISLYFIHNSMKNSCKWLILFRTMFLKMFLKIDPRCFGSFSKFQDTKKISM